MAEKHIRFSQWDTSIVVLQDFTYSAGFVDQNRKQKEKTQTQQKMYVWCTGESGQEMQRILGFATPGLLGRA